MITFGSLFAGIGGFDLGFERAGLSCKWQVEKNDFCKSVLQKHWPNVAKFNDVNKFCRRIYDCEVNLESDEAWCPRCDLEFEICECIGTDAVIDEYGNVDVICGGFPCQDISNAGLRKGIDDGKRSVLWQEYKRIICELRPRVAVVENVGAISVRGIGRVLGDLSEIGFDAEWATLPASAFGACHRRDRVFFIAYATGNRLEGWITTKETGQISTKTLDNLCSWPAISEPFGLRTTHGIPNFVDRINALGNAVVPQVAEWIGRRIVENLKKETA